MGSEGGVEEKVPSGLTEHIHHFGLEDRIDGFDGDAGTALGHCEDLWLIG